MDKKEVRLTLSIVPVETEELPLDLPESLADLLIDYGLKNGVSIVVSMERENVN